MKLNNQVYKLQIKIYTTEGFAKLISKQNYGMKGIRKVNWL